MKVKLATKTFWMWGGVDREEKAISLINIERYNYRYMRMGPNNIDPNEYRMLPFRGSYSIVWNISHNCKSRDTL